MILLRHQYIIDCRKENKTIGIYQNDIKMGKGHEEKAFVRDDNFGFHVVFVFVNGSILGLGKIT